MTSIEVVLGRLMAQLVPGLGPLLRPNAKRWL